MQAVQRMAKNSKISGSYCLAEFPYLSYAYLNLLTSLRGTIEPSLSIYLPWGGKEDCRFCQNPLHILCISYSFCSIRSWKLLLTWNSCH